MDLNNTPDFSLLVGKIYDCVAEPERWQDVLGDITREFDGLIATLAVLDIKNKTARFGSAYGEPSIVEPLISKYAAEMPFYHLVPKAPLDCPITTAQLCALHGPDGLEIFQATRLWTEWFIPHRIADALSTNLISAQDRLAAFVINFSEDRQPITQTDIDRLSLITPHIRRAISIGDLFDLHQRTSNMFSATLDDMTTAVLIVGDDLELHYANKAAVQLLKDDDPAVSIVGNRVTFKQALSHNALKQAVSIGLQDESKLGTRGLGLPLHGTPPCVAHILPLINRSAPNLFRSNAAAAIFISKAGQELTTPIDTIAALYGLTAAERRVAVQVAKGMNRQDIATANGVADGTVKSQLDAVFSKTETANQRELEKLLRDLSPPIHHD